MDFNVISKYLKENNYPDYKVKQIKDFYYKKTPKDWTFFTMLSKELRFELNSFLLDQVKLKKVYSSKIKDCLKAELFLKDRNVIESVLLKTSNRITVCVSTQVGCAVGCAFCATGKMGYKRDLTEFEIVDQIVFWLRYLKANLYQNKERNVYIKKKLINNIVFMGMGEPFLNFKNLIGAVDIINDKNGLDIGQRKISVSTVGIVSKIYEFTRLNLQINLAVSLHAVNNNLRDKLIPVNKKFPLKPLVNSCLKYVNYSNRKLFFEYCLIDNINDSKYDAYNLSKIILRHKLFHLNIIKFNPVKGINFVPSRNLEKFLKILKQNKVPFTLRKSLGEDIIGACGQLKYKKIK
jgi:23S rRNA (adenine2503-C2)-methyltransferase